MSNEKPNTKDIFYDISKLKESETYTLPSKGLLYEDGDNIPASLTLRRMTTKEDKIRLRNQSEERNKRDLLKACIKEDIDVGKLKLVDANYLLFKLRIISLLNDTYKVPCICPNCRSQFIHEIQLSDVPVKYMNKTNLKNLKVELPISHMKIELKYPSINDMIKAGDDYSAWLKQFPNEDADSKLYSMSTAIYINKVNDSHVMTEEKDAILDNMDIIDGRVLMLAINNLDNIYGFETDLKTICPNCKSEVSHGLPITSELFSPSN